MIRLLFHARTNGYVCERIARASHGEIIAVSDRDNLPHKFEGTVVRWDSKVEVAADTTINTAAAVTLSRNKRDSRLKLTGLCPETWIEFNQIQYPCIIRPRRHHAAVGFHVCHNREQAKIAVNKCGFRRWYASRLIDKELEYRVFVFKGQVFKVVRRYPGNPGQIAWNIAAGGKSVRVLKAHQNKEVNTKAVEAGKRLGLDLYAADVIVDKQGKPYVLELNTAPGLDRDKTIELVAELLTVGVVEEKPKVDPDIDFKFVFTVPGYEKLHKTFTAKTEAAATKLAKAYLAEALAKASVELDKE